MRLIIEAGAISNICKGSFMAMHKLHCRAKLFISNQFFRRNLRQNKIAFVTRRVS